MFRNYNLNFLVIFIFVTGVLIILVAIINSNSSLSVSVEESLSKCLLSGGVDSKNIHFRNSGKEYNESNWQWNSVNGLVEPLVYLMAANVSDIQTAIRCCKLLNVRIVARSGGHSFVKNGYGDSKSLVVDLGKLNVISLQPNEMQCEVGAGARMGRIVSTLSVNGNFLLPTGVCSSVGISGLTLGGGYGHTARSFGLTCDNVIEMEMVDAEGKLLVINNSTNRDLFWALRGGGGGNFGIVTKFKFKMYAAPETVLFGIYFYRFKDFAIIFNAWQNLITGLPNNFHCVLTIQNDVILMLLYAFNYRNTPTIDSFDKVLSSFPVPSGNLTRFLSYSDFILKDVELYSSKKLTHPSELANITRYNDVGWRKYKSFFVDKILTNDSISDLKALLDVYIPHVGLLIEAAGGAINDIPSSETSFIHRGNLYLVQLYFYPKQTEHPNDVADSAMKRFYEESKTVFDHRESYQNYLDLDAADYLSRYYGRNLWRLIEIKNRIDPNNVFHHPHSIPLKFD